MRLMIKEDDSHIPDKSKYILYTRDSVSEFDNYEDAVDAYKSFHGEKFLYQPDKRYFAVTISSTGFESGRKTTSKVHVIFIAKNLNQIKKFLLNDVDWHYPGYNPLDYSKYRVYIGGYGSKPVCSDIDWEGFNNEIRGYLQGILYPRYLEKDFGVIDVSSPPSGIQGASDMPFKYW